MTDAEKEKLTVVVCTCNACGKTFMAKASVDEIRKGEGLIDCPNKECPMPTMPKSIVSKQ